MSVTLRCITSFYQIYISLHKYNYCFFYRHFISCQGTTKKIELKDEVKARTRSKTKALSGSDSNAETSRKLESNLPKKSQSVEHRGDGDRSSKLLQNSVTSRTHSTKSVSKQSSGSSQSKTTKQNLTSSKSNSVKASSSQSIMKKSTSSKTRSENVVKSSDDSTVKKRKSREQGGYSEKRGLSTVYMPKSTADKHNIKTNEKTAYRTSRDKEKLKNASVPDQTKPRMSSRERRKSRTLSPSEVRMLHSAIKRPNVQDKIEQKKNDTRSNVQTDSDEDIYDYEDDFEVREYKKNRELASNNLQKKK